ncbi:hypothetical protein AUW17_07320 [Tenacibaculum dicentrarchi]|nr:hypothetical protein AUW17_07320 [Tenacibaculum dicentrarchi]
MKQFPAFRTRSFYFFLRKKQKGAQTIATIGARVLYNYCLCIAIILKKVFFKTAKRPAEFISASRPDLLFYN